MGGGMCGILALIVVWLASGSSQDDGGRGPGPVVEDMEVDAPAPARLRPQTHPAARSGAGHATEPATSAGSGSFEARDLESVADAAGDFRGAVLPRVASRALHRWHQEVDSFLDNLPPRMPRYQNKQDFESMQHLISRFLRDLRRTMPRSFFERARRVVVERGRGTGWAMPDSAELAGASSVATVAWQVRKHHVEDGDIVLSDDGEREATQDPRTVREDPRLYTSPLHHFYPAFGHKHTYVRAVRDAQRRYGQELFAIHPESFEYPAQEAELRGALAASGEGDWWIVKPVHGFSGKGIYIMDKHDPLPQASGAGSRSSSGAEFIVQRYLRPYLADGSKFDFRVYCLLLTDPLRIYMFRNGIVRLAAAPYRHEKSSIGDKCMHITNTGYQRPHCPGYVGNHHREEREFSHLWSVRKLVRHMRERLGRGEEDSWRDLGFLVARSVLANDEHLLNATRRGGHPQFQFFGPDFTLDSGGRPWVIEINAFPTTTQCCPLDTSIKLRALVDMWRIVGTTPFDRSRYAGAARARIAAFCRRAGSNCTADDMRALWTIEDEDHVRGGYELVFPAPATFGRLKHTQAGSLRQTRLVGGYLEFRQHAPEQPQREVHAEAREQGWDGSGGEDS